MRACTNSHARTNAHDTGKSTHTQRKPARNTAASAAVRCYEDLKGYSEYSHSGTQRVLRVLTSRLPQGGLGRGLRGAVAVGLGAIYSESGRDVASCGAIYTESRRDVRLAARHRAPLGKDRLPRALEVHLRSTRSTTQVESTL
jgi:hypothetical protein